VSPRQCQKQPNHATFSTLESPAAKVSPIHLKFSGKFHYGNKQVLSFKGDIFLIMLNSYDKNMPIEFFCQIPSYSV
jgi:hypothetical protein